MTARDGRGGSHSALVGGVGFDLRRADICLLREGHPGPHYGDTWF